MTDRSTNIEDNGRRQVLELSSSWLSLSISSELRHLPPAIKTRLGQIVDDKKGLWQAVMAAIPKTPPWNPGMPLPASDTPYPRKYSVQDIRLLENEVLSGRHSNIGGGMCLLLEEWGCSGVVRPTIADLINLCEQHQCALASSFLRTRVLGESTTEDSTQHFRALDNLLEKSINGNEPLIFEASTAPELWNENSAAEFSHSVSGVPELDNLLSLQKAGADDRSVSQESSSNSTTNAYLTLEKLSVENSVAEGGVGSVNRAPLEFDRSLQLVPHVSYCVLHEITDGFCDKPYIDGGRKLGEGAFGVVYKADISVKDLWGAQDSNGWRNSLLAFDDKDVKKLAIKKLNLADERVDKQFKTEVEILSQCNHPNILPLEGYSCDGPHWCLLYAFMLHGNLQDRLVCSSNTEPLTWSQRLKIGQGTAEGLAYLHTFHKNPMIHRDVKSANILLDANLLPKVGDFGLVRMGGSGARTETIVKTTTVFGTSAYMAPEAFRGDVSTKMDTFSYGVVMLEIITGLPPYDEERDGRDLLSHIEGSDASPDMLCDPKIAPWPVGLPEALFELTMLCFEDKRTRPSMVEVTTLWENYAKQWS
ncbi:Serine-threonine/tyrosine-protein kinase catalytic domain [Trinorchestia longiramus]|nr:Serine-threonine/tyrosine-protein kinase catalytic domain [Trinorchestia longiramus]